MEPHLEPNDKRLFYKYLDKAKVYFEFGSGGSTYMALQTPTLERIISVESDIGWYKRMSEQINGDARVTYVLHDLKTIPGAWGIPGPYSKKSLWKNYSETILTVGAKPDLILVDGRFRVACCLKAFAIIDDTCVVAVDDFGNRPHYNEILKYYEVIDKTIDNRMYFFRKKAVAAPPPKLIAKYEKLYE